MTYTDILLDGNWRPVFGNAATIEQAQATTPNDDTYLQGLQMQYNNTLANGGQSALMRAIEQDNAKTQPTNNAGNNTVDFMLRLNSVGKYQNPYQNNNKDTSAANTVYAASNTVTNNAADNTANAMTAQRALNLLQMAQQAAAMRPISQQLAVGWGEAAKNAEYGNLIRAMTNAQQAQASETGRVAMMANNPLINGTARV